MARTRASVGTKMSSGKSSKARCSVAPPTSSPVASSSSSRASSSGGNPACPRETPKWQKPITNFFVCTDSKRQDSDDSDEEVAESSKPTSSSVLVDEDKIADNTDNETPKNSVLDESIDLEPLNGESCHKIEEFFPKNGVKGKGLGKKTKGKENKRNSLKRDLDDNDEGNVSKKVKV